MYKLHFGGWGGGDEGAVVGLRILSVDNRMVNGKRKENLGKFVIIWRGRWRVECFKEKYQVLNENTFI